MMAISALFMLVTVPEPSVARQDQDEAQKARQRGDILSYGEIERIAENRFKGRVVGQNLRQRGAKSWVYNLRVLLPDGKVLQVVMDAKTGRVISTKGR